MKYITLWVVGVILMSPPVLAQDTLSYSLSIHYDLGTLGLADILLIEATPMLSVMGNDYTARILSYKGEVLFESTFNIQLLLLNSQPLDSTEPAPNMELTETTVDLLLPYYPNAKEIVILKKDVALLTIDVSRSSLCNENAVCDESETFETCPLECTCGNEICEAAENYMLCSEDCKSGQADNVCDYVAEGICDPDCSGAQDSDCEYETVLSQEGLSYSKGARAMKSLAVAGALVLLIILFYYLKQRKGLSRGAIEHENQET